MLLFRVSLGPRIKSGVSIEDAGLSSLQSSRALKGRGDPPGRDPGSSPKWLRRDCSIQILGRQQQEQLQPLELEPLPF